MNLKYYSAFLHWFSHFMAYEDLCTQLYPEFEYLDVHKCTIAYTLSKHRTNFDPLYELEDKLETSIYYNHRLIESITKPEN